MKMPRLLSDKILCFVNNGSYDGKSIVTSIQDLMPMARGPYTGGIGNNCPQCKPGREQCCRGNENHTDTYMCCNTSEGCNINNQTGYPYCE